MTPARVKYVSMYGFCGSQVSLFMTPAGVKYLNMNDSFRCYSCMLRFSSKDL